MTLSPSLIAPFSQGLDTDSEPWMAAADSFSIADNVHIFNGYVEKRAGYRVFGKLQKLDASVVITGITQAANGVVTTAVNHGFSTDDIVYISGVIGMTQVNNIYFTITVTALNQFELNVATAAYGAYGGAGTVAKSIDSTERVMGIYQFNRNDGTKATLAFSTKRAYIFDRISEKFLMLDAADIFNGTETDYIWAHNLQSSSLTNRLYFSNGLAYSAGTNGIRYYDGSGTGYTTEPFRPALGGGRFLEGAKLLFSLKERLLVMNTYEGSGSTVNHPQRLRWCQAQGPSNWNDLTPGGGGFVDAPTGDQIVTGRALQDQIIACFSQSVWTAQPVSDPALPFMWTKLNDFRAADGKMASLGYDRYVMAVGIRGITATDGADTQRIDTKISDFISNEINVDQFDKVFAIRSFNERRTWILYPKNESEENSGALIFDEDSKAFTTYTISMNCLGYGNIGGDYTLAYFTAEHDLDIALEDCDLETLTSYGWQGNEEQLLGGDISGTVYHMEVESSDNGSDIDAIIQTAGWNPFLSEDAQGYFSYLDIYADSDESTLAYISFYKDDEDSPYASQTIDFLPNLDYVSTIEDVSQANPGVVTASDHGLQTGNTVYLYGIFGMDAINDKAYAITVLDQNTFSIVEDTSVLPAFIGGGAVYRKAFYKTKVWKRAYAGGVGYIHKVVINCGGQGSKLRISGFKPVFKPRGKRLIN